MSTGTHDLKLQIWDTAGVESFKTLISGFDRESSGVIMGLLHAPGAVFILLGTNTDIVSVSAVGIVIGIPSKRLLLRQASRWIKPSTF